MNKLSLLLILFFLYSIFSCSSDSSEEVDLYADYIIADYLVYANSQVEDFCVSSNEKIYYIGFVNGAHIGTIDENGNTETIHNYNDSEISGSNYMGISTSNEEDIYFASLNLQNTDKFFRYRISTTETTTYQIPPINSREFMSIDYFGGDRFILFDFGMHELLMYNSISNSHTLVAGSGNSSIIDGIGSNASFISVDKMTIKNEIIYVIDNSNNLRKIEKIGSEFKVTTLISNNSNPFYDVSINNNGDLLVMVAEHGIYKYNELNNSLEEYLTGELKIKVNDGYYENYWGEYLSHFSINGNDLYLKTGTNTLIKISNYEEKFNL